MAPMGYSRPALAVLAVLAAGPAAPNTNVLPTCTAVTDLYPGISSKGVAGPLSVRLVSLDGSGTLAAGVCRTESAPD